jgi:hypothetical protein
VYIGPATPRGIGLAQIGAALTIGAQTGAALTTGAATIGAALTTGAQPVTIGAA